MAAESFQWRSRPIFLSSTFRDMHVERDYLREHAFLLLGDKLRERAHYLDTIDLRQGVEVSGEDAEARELEVLTVCLAEIERSKPFLIALLGDRYGYMPVRKVIEATARGAGLPASIEVAGKSVTELEILYGVLENPDQRRRSWFYFRTIDRSGMPTEVQARFPAEEPSQHPSSPAAKLAALKARIKKELPDRWREYTLSWDQDKQALAGLDTLDGLVEHDLWGDLEAETATYLRDAPRTWQEAEARALADFVTERTRGYVARPAVTEPMLAHAKSSTSPEATWGLCVTGESGAGKSSLFGTTFTALNEHAKQGELLLLAHAAGISPMSGQVDRMLRRWSTQLAAFVGVEDVLEQRSAAAVKARGLEERSESQGAPTSQEIEKTFAALLWRATQQTRVVVLIDALNQFEPTVRAEHLTWLPKAWPPNARLVATAIAGTASSTLAHKAGCSEQPVPKVSRDEADVIARRFYRERYYHDVNKTVLDALLDNKLPDGAASHGNPLWLALALQEMNFLEADDFEQAERKFAHLPEAARIQALQLAEAAKLPADAPGVYGELLARAERSFGVAFTRACVELIALGRAGWRESDLRACVPLVSGEAWDDLAFAGLRRVLGTHIVQRGAHDQWDFFHAALRQTLAQRNLGDAGHRRRLHGVVAYHLFGLPGDDPVRLSEVMVHLLGLGHQELAAAYLADNAWHVAACQGAVAVLVQALEAAPDETAREQLISWLAGLLGDAPANHPRVLGVSQLFLFQLNAALASSAATRTEATRAQLLTAARDALQRLHDQNPNDAEAERGLAVSLDKLGDYHLRHAGDADRAFELFQQSHETLQRLHAQNPNDAVVGRALSVSFSRLGDYHLRRAGGVERALELFQRSLDIAQRLHDPNPNDAQTARDLSVLFNKCGTVARAQGKLGEAQRLFSEALKIAQRLADTNQGNAERERDLSASLNQLGDLAMAQGKLDEAGQLFTRGLEIAQRLADEDPTNTLRQRDLSLSCDRLGGVAMAQERIDDARELFTDGLRIAQHLADVNPTNAERRRDVTASLSKVGDVAVAQGNLGEAQRLFAQGLRIARSLADADPANTEWQRNLSVFLNKVSEVAMAQGNLAEAQQPAKEGFRIARSLADLDPTNTERRCDLSVSLNLLGRVARAYGKIDVAQQLFAERLRIVQSLADSDPENTVWQRELALSHYNLGYLALERTDVATMKTHLKRAFEILTLMRRRGSHFDPKTAQAYKLLAPMFDGGP